jgi:hypothetical protein
MQKKYVVKKFGTEIYFQGWDFGWEGRNEWDCTTPYLFESLEDAEICISRYDGTFQIEIIYIN